MKFFIKDFRETMQVRVVIFGMQVDNDVSYPGIANQPSPVYSSLYLSNFLSFHTLNDEFLVKDFYFCETVQARVVIIGEQGDNDVFIVGLRTSLLLLILPCICPIFFLSILCMMKFFVKN